MPIQPQNRSGKIEDGSRTRNIIDYVIRNPAGQTLLKPDHPPVFAEGNPVVGPRPGMLLSLPVPVFGTLPARP